MKTTDMRLTINRNYNIDSKNIKYKNNLLSIYQANKLKTIIRHYPDSKIIVFRENGDGRNAWKKYNVCDGYFRLGYSRGCRGSRGNYHSTWAHVVG